ncbi:hypothetical protein [Sutcliffiella rhizosphaerae]|nr:hypothetical protein [Sutcliffiella rhizosphaerae]
MVACKTEEISNENFVHWTEKTDNQLQRLDEARIKYEIRDMEIWINEKDLDKAVVCCS